MTWSERQEARTGAEIQVSVFFSEYRDHFNRLDGRGIARLWHAPSGVMEGTQVVWFDDADEIRRRGIATVPEGHQVLRELTVRDNLLVASGGLSRGEMNAAIDRVLGLFPELKEKLQQPAGDLSGGQQQMVAIAQALIVNPRFLVIDELSFGLAPTIVARLVPIIRRIADSGIGVLLIEQFTQLALALAHHVYVMSRGTVSYDGEPGKLRDDPDILHRAYFPVSSKEAVGL